MQTFVIRRRNAWKNAQELETTAGVSLRIGNDEMADKVRWIRSYVVNEDDGTLGTVCIYQAVDADAIREHARRVGMPANEITEVAKTVIIRDDPVEFEEAA
jgi:sporulation protein YlmC with PRC-barrel domain